MSWDLMKLTLAGVCYQWKAGPARSPGMGYQTSFWGLGDTKLGGECPLDPHGSTWMLPVVGTKILGGLRLSEVGGHRGDRVTGDCNSVASSLMGGFPLPTWPCHITTPRGWDTVLCPLFPWVTLFI